MHRTLVAVYLSLDLLLLGASTLCIVSSTVWRQPDVLVSLVFLPRHFNAALSLGLLLASTFLLSIPALTAPPNKSTPLKLLGGLLLLDTLVAVGAGTAIWLDSLGQREAYAARWVRYSDRWRSTLEDKVGPVSFLTWHCCGYWNATEAGLFLPASSSPDVNLPTSTTFCAGLLPDGGQAAAGSPPPTGCIDHLLQYTDRTLENTFSSIYGCVCITIALALTTACLVNERKRIVRFRKIDLKRGGSGFV